MQQWLYLGFVRLQTFLVQKLHVLEVVISGHAYRVGMGILHDQRRNSSRNLEVAKCLAVDYRDQIVPVILRELTL